MSIICDFHIHSKYSRATSKNMTLPIIAEFAERKGIDVVGTGDFVHPGWLSEIKDNLSEDYDGLLKLKDVDSQIRFILTCEISSIYKKNNKVRKVHNLLLFPSLDDAEKFSDKLDNIGNIRSDGRPILGLDSKILLEIALDINENIVFIPAHIWTPWFSLFGAKSGFDTIEECFEDLTEYIFALETGLSSDPPMNWRWSALDRFTLVSNSDAHSPANLARESNILFAEANFSSIRNALKNKSSVETLEFYPEEGKYHFDGHRKCNVRLTPEEAIKINNICPVCGKPLTMGVFHRIVEIADREKPVTDLQKFRSIVPLAEILSQILDTGAKSKKVEKIYNELINVLGNELKILKDVEIDVLSQVGGEVFARAVKNMRENRIRVEPGFDGEYGKIILLSNEEKEFFSMKNGLFSHINSSLNKEKRKSVVIKLAKHGKKKKIIGEIGVDKFQREAIEAENKLIIIQAGPGTGKTFTLAAKAKKLLENGVIPSEICIVTFTNKACDELKERIGKRGMEIATFHSLCIKILKESNVQVNIISPEEQDNLIKTLTEGRNNFVSEISALKKELVSNDKDSVLQKKSLEFAEIFNLYEKYLKENGLMDFDDIIIEAVKKIRGRSDLFPFKYLLVDEFQDIDAPQFALLENIFDNLKMLFVIGDENQSIYGFRGGSNKFFGEVEKLGSDRVKVLLKKSHRSCKNILDFSEKILCKNISLQASRQCKGKLEFLRFVSEREEAKYIVNKIKELIGGIDFLTSESSGNLLSFRDIAILYRVHNVSRILEDVFLEEGIPFEKSKDVVYSELEDMDLKSEKVKLLSFHAAKGLDFKAVFIVGVENGLVPFQHDTDEERRLLYVAVTRAKDILIITSCRKRFLFGEYYKEKSKYLETVRFKNIKSNSFNKKGIFF